MPRVKREHFERAAADIAAHGDNDTLPFDIDTRFTKEKQRELVDVAYKYSEKLRRTDEKSARGIVESTKVFSERLLSPTGTAGFRVVTKMHPFWGMYFNGLGVAIAEALEPKRSDRVHSYRFVTSPERIFDRAATWRSFREATIRECEESGTSFVVQTDISSFYEHVYHHRLENFISDLFADEPRRGNAGGSSPESLCSWAFIWAARGRAMLACSC